MRRHLAPGTAALAALCLSACGLVGDEAESRAGRTATVSAVRAPFHVVVRADGELEAPNASPIAVPPVPTGALKVREVVPEGAVVEKGQVILEFDDTQLNIDLENHTATFRSAERKIDRTRIDWGIEEGSIDVMKTVAGLERDHASEFQLEDDVIYTRREVLESQLDKEYAEEKIVFADGKLRLRDEYFSIDERILEVEKEQASGKMGRVNTSLGNLILEAPLGGMVVYRKNWRGSTVTVGDTLWPGNVVLSIVDPTETVLKVDILEKDAAGVEVGAAASVRIDAHAERVFRGTVSEVSKLARPIERGSPVKYFQAKIALEDGDPALLKPGMKGEARIVVADLEDAVIVPRSAVHGVEGEYHVFLAGPRGPAARPVELGPGDLVRVSITGGLDGGEAVLLGDPPDAPQPEVAKTGPRSGGSPTAPAGM